MLFSNYWIWTRPVEDVSVIVFEPPLLFAKVMFPIEAVGLPYQQAGSLRLKRGGGALTLLVGSCSAGQSKGERGVGTTP